ncbi:hypothetical protein RDI58_022549 [Solanum bulbocastanum]|uniref:Uncharacterized protein n=1 Tax=Solanum bulbocastanum TaxID=147425 RepID=A0AAN8T295_SOLBU
MSAKEEVGESRAHVVYNGSASGIYEIGLQLYPVSKYDSGEGLLYAPVDWPNVGIKWGWRAGKIVTSSSTFRDKYLYLPKYFKALKGGKKNAFRNMKERTISLAIELQSLLSDSPTRAITCKAGSKIYSNLTIENPFSAMLCDICCSKPIFCRYCCCILCCKIISSYYDGYNYIRCEETTNGYIYGHVSHLDCALQAYMAGTVGGSINLDAQYFHRY